MKNTESLFVSKRKSPRAAEPDRDMAELFWRDNGDVSEECMLLILR